MERNGTKRFLFWVFEFAILLVFWFLYVDKLAWDEAAVGVGAAALAATGAEVVRGLRFARFYPYRQWLLLAWRIPGMVLHGARVMVKAFVRRYFLGREIESKLATTAFDPGGDDPRSAARRALAIVYTTLSPDSIVIDIDRRARLMLLHLMGDAVPAVTKELGARE